MCLGGGKGIFGKLLCGCDSGVGEKRRRGRVCPQLVRTMGGVIHVYMGPGMTGPPSACDPGGEDLLVVERGDSFSWFYPGE